MDLPLGSDPVATLHVRLRRDAGGYPPFESEELSGLQVGDHLFKLTTVPAFASGLANGDVVHVRRFPDIEGLWVDELVSPGEHSTMRVIGLHGNSSEGPREIAVRHGGAVSATPVDGLLAIDVPPEADFRAMYQELQAGRETGQWDINVGVMSNVHAGQMQGIPLA
jgi:hypothetical protein